MHRHPMGTFIPLAVMARWLAIDSVPRAKASFRPNTVRVRVRVRVRVSYRLCAEGEAVIHAPIDPSSRPEPHHPVQDSG